MALGFHSLQELLGNSFYLSLFMAFAVLCADKLV